MSPSRSALPASQGRNPRPGALVVVLRNQGSRPPAGADRSGVSDDERRRHHPERKGEGPSNLHGEGPDQFLDFLFLDLLAHNHPHHHHPHPHPLSHPPPPL